MQRHEPSLDVACSQSASVTYSVVCESPNGTSSSKHLADAVRVAEIKEIIDRRNLRRQVFGLGFSDGPAWDILLELYLAHEQGQQLSLTCLGLSTNVPETTSLRWLRRLAQDALATVHTDARDGRRKLVRLTPEASLKMSAYFRKL